MKNKTYFLLTASLFAIVAILHFVRVVFDQSFYIGLYEVPMLISWIAFIVTALFAYHGFRLKKKTK